MDDATSSPSPTALCFSNSTTDKTIALRSTDHDMFYVSKDKMKLVSQSPHSTAAAPEGFIAVPVKSSVLHIMLHILYKSLCPIVRTPPLPELVEAVDNLPAYGISPSAILSPRLSPFYDILVAYISSEPVTIFALASRHDIESLAVQSSMQALVYAPYGFNDDIANRIGTHYLRRILALHAEAFSALRRIIREPPEQHPQLLPDCRKEDVEALAREWNRIASGMCWSIDSLALAPSQLRDRLLKVGEAVKCQGCKRQLLARVEHVVAEWANVKWRGVIFPFSLPRVLWPIARWVGAVRETNYVFPRLPR